MESMASDVSTSFASRLCALADALDDVTLSLPPPGQVSSGEETRPEDFEDLEEWEELVAPVLHGPDDPNHLAADAEDTDSDDEDRRPSEPKADAPGLVTDVLLRQLRERAPGVPHDDMGCLNSENVGRLRVLDSLD
mmetsp:Transcript_14001/g.26152  ORF Transcript_14001/g.26152 Transcript_14001/m.26152 type:complete len:136 (+) Transcript_14001:61-468(+)